MVGKSKVIVYHSHHTNLSVEFISFGCPPVFGGRGGVPKRTHVALEDDVVWDWVILAENWSWHGSLSREQRRQLVTPLVTFHVSLIHKKFLHFFAGILKKTKQDMYGSSNPKGYHWKNKVSTPALWIVWTTLIKKGHKGDKYIWNDLELPIQLSLSHEKKKHTFYYTGCLIGILILVHYITNHFRYLKWRYCTI